MKFITSPSFNIPSVPTIGDLTPLKNALRNYGIHPVYDCVYYPDTPKETRFLRGTLHNTSLLLSIGSDTLQFSNLLTIAPRNFFHESYRQWDISCVTPLTLMYVLDMIGTNQFKKSPEQAVKLLDPLFGA